MIYTLPFLSTALSCPRIDSIEVGLRESLIVSGKLVRSLRREASWRKATMERRPSAAITHSGPSLWSLRLNFLFIIFGKTNVVWSFSESSSKFPIGGGGGRGGVHGYRMEIYVVLFFSVFCQVLNMTPDKIFYCDLLCV